MPEAWYVSVLPVAHGRDCRPYLNRRSLKWRSLADNLARQIWCNAPRRTLTHNSCQLLLMPRSHGMPHESMPHGMPHGKTSHATCTSSYRMLEHMPEHHICRMPGSKFRPLVNIGGHWTMEFHGIYATISARGVQCHTIKHCQTHQRPIGQPTNRTVSSGISTQGKKCVQLLLQSQVCT